jgi:decaprenylphospho-beta-D-erythro-pentofuranosid-2-ulose 2-reductase
MWMRSRRGDGAIDKGGDIVYVPGMWRIIMGVIRIIPERIFEKLNL